MILVAMRLRRFSRLKGLAAVAAIATACGPGKTVVRTGGAIEGCPRNWGDVLPRDSLLLPGSITNIPEFHDCQRFVVAGERGLRYVAIFAIFSAWDLRNRWDSVAGNVPAAADTGKTVDVDSLVGVPADSVSLTSVTTLASSASGKRAWSFVEILTRGTYARLGIGPGVTCGYIYYAAPNVLQAKMVTRAEEWDCRRPVDPDTLDGVLLQVNRSQPMGDRVDAHYPPAARWEWDSAHKLQYFGVKCGNAWCSVGPGRFEPAADLGVASRHPVFHVNGWFDRQRLAAVPDANSGSTTSAAGPALKPDSGWGTVFPDSLLVSYRIPDFANQWKLSARVALDASLARYEQKLNLAPVPLTRRPWNRILLCFGEWKDCHSAAMADTVQFYRRSVRTSSVGLQGPRQPVNSFHSLRYLDSTEP